MTRNKVTTGDFRFGEAILDGVIVRTDPEHKVGRGGTSWIETSILVNLYDSRQRAERDRPVFVRVRVFEKTAPNAYSVLESCNQRDRIAVAGQLRIQNYEAREGGMREAFELVADYVVRNDKFESLANLLAGEERGQRGSSETPANEEGPEPQSGEDRYGPVPDKDVPF